MNISEGDLDNLLRNKWGPEASSSKATSSTSSASSEHYHKTSHGGDVTKLQSAVFGMNSFVDKVSALAGAEFPWYVICTSGVYYQALKTCICENLGA